MESIRVRTGIAVEVNDQGETINIPTDDSDFSRRFDGLIKSIQTAANDIKDCGIVDRLELMNYQTKKMQVVMQSIDDTFGAETCRKVFGNIVPSPIPVMDFFEQISPIVKRGINERKKMIESKYPREKK